MKKLHISHSFILSLGSGAASVCNFYSYVFLPSLLGTAHLEHFVRANYLGGLYLFGIGSSIAPMAIFILAAGRRPALMKYLAVSAMAIPVILIGGHWLVLPPWTYFCLSGALLLHIVGFFYASLIREERFLTACCAQVIQPFVFALLISLGLLHIKIVLDWSVAYLISAVLSLGFFFTVSNLHRIKEALSLPASEKIGWLGVFSRVGFCVSFPIFFQLELILCGRFSMVNVGVYAMLQKLYASISISLFGAIGVYLLSKHLDAKTGHNRLVDRETVLLAGLSSLCVPLVGFGVLLLTHGGKGLSSHLFLFTICALVGLRLSALRPVLGLEFFAVSIALYLIGFMIMRPETAGGFLFLASLFFGIFLCLAISEDRFRTFERVMPWRRRVSAISSNQELAPARVGDRD
jgi:hypothetical protein